MGLDPNSRARFNLSQTTVLLLDPTQMGMSILVQILVGLGAKHFYRCSSVAEARGIVESFEIDLMIVDGMPMTGEGYDFVRWLREEASEPNKFAPVLLTAAHTMMADVRKSRDCGGHFIVAKPLSPIVMLERIIWVAKGERSFIFSDGYVGPDRRFNQLGPPQGKKGRRREDKNPAIDQLAAPGGENPMQQEGEAA